MSSVAAAVSMVIFFSLIGYVLYTEHRDEKAKGRPKLPENHFYRDELIHNAIRSLSTHQLLWAIAWIFNVAIVNGIIYSIYKAHYLDLGLVMIAMLCILGLWLARGNVEDAKILIKKLQNKTEEEVYILDWRPNKPTYKLVSADKVKIVEWDWLDMP